MRTDNAMTNTHGKVVQGIVISRGQFSPAALLVWFTSDEKGETISFQSGDTMIIVPFEGVKELITETREGKQK